MNIMLQDQLLTLDRLKINNFKMKIDRQIILHNGIRGYTLYSQFASRPDIIHMTYVICTKLMM